MSSEWVSHTFGDLVEFISKKSKPESASLTTYISTENMLPDFGGIRTAVTLPLKGNVTNFETSDTLFSNIRTYFRKVWQAEFNGHCSNDVLVFRSKNKKILHPDYLYNLCRWEQFTEFSIRTSKGAKMPRGDKEALALFEFKLPDIETQTKITQTLRALDDRITLLRETNKTLESIAQAIFKSWFVDFDPVHAKMEGRQLEGMDEATAALFPDSFEESEPGLIPEGWSSGSLSDLSNLNPESWTAKNHPHTLLYVDLANTKSNVFSEVSELLFSEAPSRARRVLRNGDTIIGTVRPGNKSFAFIHTALKNMTGSTGFAVLRPKTKFATEFVYLAATQESSIEYLTHIADGAAYPAVRSEIVARLSCVIPSKEILREFHNTASILFTAIAQNQSEAKTLTSLRDTLLPRLISGKLRLPELQEATAPAQP